ncbi:hypothetical protein BJ322DRAFT_1014326 [Thelephora terrestris]|uniref:Uncharacterized protein n=1 Tax=Thelephora terrestris TaxID=56493 RepID=A0A9P6H3P1_9AGAM|nr:hypothetical protein BJ322DRAFT_1014326 [Thelephora terrestris]
MTTSLGLSHSGSLGAGEIPPLKNSSPTPLTPPSETEAYCYYVRLPSRPVLVARSGIPWVEPTGPEAYSQDKELHPVGNHPIRGVWEDDLALKIHALLDSMKVKWTSTDVVRIGDAGEPTARVILWIGVTPTSLSGDDGVIVAYKCKGILQEYNINKVNVEIRESVVSLSAGPKLLTSASNYFSDPIADVREPLTTTLGLPICAQSTPWVEGTGGFFITEGENTERLLLVTARHVILPQDKNENKHFEFKDDDQNRCNVTLFGDVAFSNYLKSIKHESRLNGFSAEYRETCIRGAEEKNDRAACDKRQNELDEIKEAAERLKTLHQDVLNGWATPENRILGHVILSPPINFGVGSSSEGYTEDWAVIEIDASKIDTSNFDGNAVDLGNRISPGAFSLMMSPIRQEPRSFQYPFDRLLRLKGTIPDEEMRHPTAVDKNNHRSLTVIKRGSTTGLTVGHANNVCSYARYCYEDDNPRTSKEWAILPFDYQSRAFSEKGDSGAVIIDGHGRIGGLLTGGTGKDASSLDITYATPISFLLKRMQEQGLHKLNLSPVLTT